MRSAIWAVRAVPKWVNDQEISFFQLFFLSITRLRKIIGGLSRPLLSHGGYRPFELMYKRR